VKTRLFLVALLSALLVILIFGLTGGVTAQKDQHLEKPKMELSANLTLVSISPSSFANGVNMPVTIIGNNLDAVVSATLGTVALRNLEIVSSTQVTALVPWSIITGSYDLKLTDSNGLSATLTGAVTVTEGDLNWTSNGPYGGDLWDVVIDPVNSSRMFVSGYRSGLWTTADGGANWDYSNTDPLLERARIVYSATDQPPAIYVSNYRSLDYGQTWEDNAPPAYSAVQGGGEHPNHFIRPDQPTWVYFGIAPRNDVEPLGGVYTSTDRGDTWSFITSTSGLNVTALGFDPDNHDYMIVGTTGGQVYTSINSGATWSAPITLADHIQQLMFEPTLYSGKRSQWAVSAYGWQYHNDMIYRSRDGGQTWTSIQVITGSPIYDIAFHDSISGLLWSAVGNGYYSEDDGDTWQPIGAGLDEVHGFVVVPGAISRQTTTLFAITKNGLYKSTDGGATWAESDNGLGANLANWIAISPFNADEAYASTEAKGVQHTVDGGRHWQSLPIRTPRYNNISIATDPFTDGKVYFGNDFVVTPTVRVSTDHGRTFTEYQITLPITYAGRSADVKITPAPTIHNRLLAGLCLGDGDLGFIYASVDGGATWTQQTTPADIKCITRLTFDPTHPNIVYAGSSGYGLLRSTDSGATWVPLANQPTTGSFMSIEIDPNDSNSIYLAVFAWDPVPAGIFVTHDSGDTWLQMTGVDGPDWALKFCKVGESNWLYAATMSGLRYLRSIPDDPTTPWQSATGIAATATVDGFNCATEDGRVVTYIGTSGGIVNTSSNVARQPTAAAGSQNMGGGIYRALTPGSLYETPGWKLRNRSGFGNHNNMISALEVFNGQLYAATSNWADGGGARVWRLTQANNWTLVSEVGMSSTYSQTNPALTDLVTFNGQLYASLGWGANEGQIWRTSNGTDWTKVTGNEFGGSTKRTVTVMTVFSNTLYAAAGTPVEIWRSNTGDKGSWERVAQNGLGNPNNTNMTGAATFNGALYVSLVNTVDGISVWRTANGTMWTQVNTSGFGDVGNSDSGGMATLNGYLYVGMRNTTTGGQVWRFDGTNWSRVVADGFGNVNNEIDSLYTVQNWLFAVAGNTTTGLQVRRTTNGTDWTALNLNGLGNSNNTFVLWSNSSTAFANSFYLGIWNGTSGGEVWQYVIYPVSVYLPLVRK
jgi:hypothetical protein